MALFPDHWYLILKLLELIFIHWDLLLLFANFGFILFFDILELFNLLYQYFDLLLHLHPLLSNLVKRLLQHFILLLHLVFLLFQLPHFQVQLLHFIGQCLDLSGLGGLGPGFFQLPLQLLNLLSLTLVVFLKDLSFSLHILYFLLKVSNDPFLIGLAWWHHVLNLTLGIKLIAFDIDACYFIITFIVWEGLSSSMDWPGLSRSAPHAHSHCLILIIIELAVILAPQDRYVWICGPMLCSILIRGDLIYLRVLHHLDPLFAYPVAWRLPFNEPSFRNGTLRWSFQSII